MWYDCYIFIYKRYVDGGNEILQSAERILFRNLESMEYIYITSN